MIKININELQNDLFSVNKSPYEICDTQIIEYSTSPMSSMNTSSSIYSTISPSLYSKSIKLNCIEFNIDTRNFNQDKIEFEIKSFIKNHLKNEFIKKLYEVGKKGRNLSNSEYYKFDIDLDKIINNNKNKFDPDEVTKKNIYGIIVSACNQIAMLGRIGPGNFIIFNKNVYKEVYHKLKHFNRMNTNAIKYEISDLIKEDYIIVGRKNELNNQGIHAIIKTTGDYLDITENITSFGITRYRIQFAVEEIGSSIENQVVMLDTKNLSYYRREKLKKIISSSNE